MRKIRNILFQLTLAYVLVLGAVYGLQRFLMYHPESTPFNPVQVGLTELQPLDTQIDGLGTLRHWMILPRNGGFPTIVYFQGNTGGLDQWQYKFREWIEKGYGLLLVGYPGFGNPGSPTEEGLYAAGRAALKGWQNNAYKTDGYILYGFSLGTGVATQMATESKPLALVLEAPYTSLADVAQVHYPYLPTSWLIKDRFDTINKIGQVKAPVLVLHGLSDEVIPVEEGQKVFEAAQKPKISYFPALAHHNDLYDFGAGQTVIDFIDGL